MAYRYLYVLVQLVNIYLPDEINESWSLLESVFD